MPAAAWFASVIASVTSCTLPKAAPKLAWARLRLTGLFAGTERAGMIVSPVSGQVISACGTDFYLDVRWSRELDRIDAGQLPQCYKAEAGPRK
jgi:hypothetical protein